MRLSALVVDLAVLGPQAWEWLERLCGALPELGIVVCTGPSTVAQRVRGLRLGADDWITKPCHPEEVIARVQSVVRRRRRTERPHRGQAADRPARSRSAPTASRRSSASTSLDLTRREFELIELLAAAEGRVLEREEIYSRLWGYTMVRGDRSVDVFVRKLRQKLEKASPRWRYIHTHFGIGYRFAAESLDVDRSRSTCRPQSPPPGTPAIRASSRGRMRTASSPPTPSSRTTASPPFFRSTRPPVRSRDHAREVGLVADEQQAPVGADRRQRLERLRAVEARPRAARARAAARAAPRCHASAASSAVCAGAHLRAEQDRVEAHAPGAPARRPPRAPAARRARSGGARSPRAFRAARPLRDVVARADEPLPRALTLRVDRDGSSTARCRRCGRGDRACRVRAIVAAPGTGTRGCSLTVDMTDGHDAAAPTSAPRARRRRGDLHDPSLYLNRELSWLDFNDRVLQLAEDERAAAARAREVLRDLHDQPRRVLHGARRRPARPDRRRRREPQPGRAHARPRRSR